MKAAVVMHNHLVKSLTTVALLSILAPAFAQDFLFKKVETNVNSSFRALSVVDNKVAWIGGSNGWVGHTKNGGKSWKFSQVNGFETVGFRSVYAFNAKKAVVANAGTPANILITGDGGMTWKLVYQNEHKDAFFDGIDFWNEHEGIIYGDPIDGKMLLLKTNDGGESWNEVASSPTLQKGEASFAASGTGVRCIGNAKVVVATGGTISRLWISDDQGLTWNTVSPPIVQGESTTGIYSLASNGAIINLVGGDYTKPSMAIKHNLYSLDDGTSWNTPHEAARGYRECVEFISDDTWITTGPTGTDVSYDNGKNWKALSGDEGYHVLRKARSGSLLIAAGAAGQISIVKNVK